ncbi:hypothetical protein GIB67_003469 [Kingdonia uniflora]|uniref:Uncharacterized protein n=1 Tax=Kingdonia uniflora TaxID=39325 RepID=A0A7J7MED1_9MAGN|nr:hypothetical protein GIB67_003469 [Kingdonia uniflora]
MDVVLDKLKEFTYALLYNPQSYCCRHNPIEILKRLQREAFSDTMKLRDRLDKHDRLLSSFHKSTTNGTPFNHSATHLSGEVDVGGALLLVDNVGGCTALNEAGIRTGIHSRLTFQTNITSNDAFAAEFVSTQSDKANSDDVLGSPLSLTKVMYSTNFNNCVSAVVIPWGARCKDVAVASNPLPQERTLTDFTSIGPPIFGHYHDVAVALIVKRSNFAASFSELVSTVRRDLDSAGISRCFSTFGQITYGVSKGTKLSLLGLHKKLIAQSQEIQFCKFTIPIGNLRAHRVPDAYAECHPDTSVALMLESELDDSTRLKGWIEMQNSTPRCLQWAVTMSDTPEDQLGWGLSLGGTWDRFQVEAFLKLNIGGRCSLQPGIMYVTDNSGGIPALMFRSSWAF